LLIESGLFKHLRRKQPGTGAFLDTVASVPREQRPRVQFVFFDRVPGSDTTWHLTSVYELKDVYVDSAAGLSSEGQEFYTLALDRLAVLDPPIAFGQASPLWDSLETTRGKKTATFYGGGRMLLPLPQEDFEAILAFHPEPDVLEAEAEGLLAPATSKPGIQVPVPVESILQAYLADNLGEIEDGLEPYEAENYVERQTDDRGRIDLLCRDKQGAVVVIELKKGKADDAVVGQLARYMGWVKERLANGSAVRGIIIANVISDRLRYASKAFSDVRLLSYDVKFSFRAVE